MPDPLLPPGPQQTPLATLHARALDTTRRPHPLNDTHAVETLNKLMNYHDDHDFASNTGMALPESAGICLRARILDAWTFAFLQRHAHEPVTVVHLACGLDARCSRVPHREGVRWVDVDLEEVVSLRRKVMPPPSGDYSLVVGSAADVGGWLGRIPADRPTVAVFEGLTMYLREEGIV
ncbi:S-adenosyl-L-methionine-dependent methyltransferase [Schizothecium vesticola]|uniref:S-adenosyl-L-methionine-dependent methyltransferase n=1 Tax=Schizothecium vesticola TaxID=314040 RepID=A0AA40EFS7_9PEZI|nr:S-adenosyl-L-methionine-dependent methyltransferase [Schizothecium vesticola]